MTVCGADLVEHQPFPRAEREEGWLDELHFGDSGAPWLALGTRRTDRWWTPITDRGAKERLLREHRSEVLAGPPAVLPALEQAALLVEEDLCLLRPDDAGRHVLVAGCVCAPSHWRLTEKLGLTIAAVHGPVARYEDELAARVDQFLARLRPGVIVARRNWMVHETPVRFEPVCPPTAGVPPAEQWLRSERQTLQRLPGHGSVLFTIATDMAQLGEVPRAVRRALAERLAAEPPDLLAYRDVAERATDLIGWLRQ